MRGSVMLIVMAHLGLDGTRKHTRSEQARRL
jgi:hypothetical protein